MIIIGDTIPQIADEAAYAEAVNRAAGLFKTEEMRKAARFAAAVHEHAADYLEQAPALAIAIMAGGGKINGGPANRAYAAHKFGGLCASGARLREVLGAYGLPLQIRQLKPLALGMGDEDALRGLAKLPPSTLAQAIPTAAGKQRRWLSAVGAWRARLRWYARPLDQLALWAYPQMAKHRVRPAEASDLCDFHVRGDMAINPDWEWPRAAAASRDWHDRLSAGDAKKKFGVMADQIIDLGQHPDHLVVSGYEFIALRTPIAIHADGQSMRHCVGSYIQSVMGGQCSIVSVQQDECRIATLELVSGKVRQIKGRFNAAPIAEVRAAATEYAAQVRKLARSEGAA